MAGSIKANVKSELIRWGRQMSGMPRAIAAQKMNVSEERLIAWEAGGDSPTIAQLRKMAAVYKQNFAAFFMPVEPVVPDLPLKDYRRLPGAVSHELSYQIVQDVRLSMNKRLMALELMSLNGIEPIRFDLEGSVQEGVTSLSGRIRSDLNVSMADQTAYRVPNVGFNKWRQAIESVGVLVFQSSSIDVFDMRGYSIYEDRLPVIVVNRKDTEHARIFTMIHELAHIYLRASGICDLQSRTDVPPEEQYLEVFCNEVAANVLVPLSGFNGHAVVVDCLRGGHWPDQCISALSRDFCVSREVIARRLLEVGYVDHAFYQEKREQYNREYEQKKLQKKGGPGFVPPSVDCVSKSGRFFSDLVVRSLLSSRIDSSQASDYLGVKIPHIRKIQAALGY